MKLLLQIVLLRFQMGRWFWPRWNELKNRGLDWDQAARLMWAQGPEYRSLGAIHDYIEKDASLGLIGWPFKRGGGGCGCPTCALARRAKVITPRFSLRTWRAWAKKRNK